MHCFGNRHENLHRWDFVHRPPLCSLRFPNMANKQTLYHRITRNHYKPRDTHVVPPAPIITSMVMAIIYNAISRSSCRAWDEALLSQSSGTMVLSIVGFDAFNLP